MNGSSLSMYIDMDDGYRSFDKALATASFELAEQENKKLTL